MHKWYSVTTRAWQCMVDSLAPGLPAEPVRDTLNLVRQDGAWRVRLFLHVRKRIRAAADAVAFGDHSLTAWLGLRPWPALGASPSPPARADITHLDPPAPATISWDDIVDLTVGEEPRTRREPRTCRR